MAVYILPIGNLVYFDILYMDMLIVYIQSA